MKQISTWMGRVAHAMEDEAALEGIANEVRALCERFPAPGMPS